MQGWINWLAACLLPLRCRICAQPGADGLDLCPACHGAAQRNLPACPGCALPLPQADGALCGQCQRRPGRLLACHAAWCYGPTIDVLVRRYKFDNDLAAGAVLAGLMCQLRPPWLSGQVLVPVSLHRQRLAQRGYDQAHELATQLGRATGLPVMACLQRCRDTAAQSALDRKQRRRNLRGAFTVTAAALPASVVLVDDVMTTGATLEAAAQALQRAGVEQVRAWVAARTV
jgi:ComF family protein